jgi:hypothetical protein
MYQANSGVQPKEGLMRTVSLVMNSDQVNRYGMRFPLSTLVSALRQGIAGTPMFMSHDMHRPIGWSAARGIAVHAGVNYLVGVAKFPTSDEEERRIEQAALGYLASKLGQVEPKDKVRLETVAGAYFSAEAAEFMSRECATLVQTGIAKALFPHLFPETENDKRGLIPLVKLKPIGPGVYEVDNGVCVFAHRYMRRSASRWNNLNVPFLERFQRAAKEESAFEAKIALDPDAIGLVETFRQPIELEYWWGPKFSDNLAEIKTNISRHAATPHERLFHRIERTEFWWYDQNELRAFECEEVLDGQTLGIETGDKYACRYAHSMVDLAKNVPHHLDGAVRIYSEEAMLARLELDMAEAGRRSEYVKLWRADGKIPVPLWKSLVSDYFRDNHLVSEYLGAQNDSAAEAQPQEEPESMHQSHAPIEFSEEHSPAYLVSIWDKREPSPGADVQIWVDNTLSRSDGRQPAADLVSLDLLKRLEQTRLTVRRPADSLWIAYEDLHVELPRIEVVGEASASTVCRCLAGWLRDRGEIGGVTTTGSLEFTTEAQTLRLAFLGMPSRLARGFELLASANPGVFSDAFELLQALQPVATNATARHPDVLQSFRSDATFRLGRGLLPPTAFATVANESSTGVPPMLAQQIGLTAETTSEFYAVPAFLVKESVCDDCGQSYIACPCEAVQRPSDFELLGYLLTRHPA